MIKPQNILKNRNFLKIWGAQIAGQITGFILNFILINTIYERTGSTVAVALIWVFYSLPSVFVGPFSGVFVDLWSKRKIMLIVPILQGLTLVFYLLTQEHIYLSYFSIFLYSLSSQFYIPSEAASIPWLVEKKYLPVANSLFLLTSQLAFMVGFGSGGILISLIDKNIVIIICASLLFLASFFISFLPKDKNLTRTKSIKENYDLWVNGVKRIWSYLSVKGRLVFYSFGILAFFQVVTASLGSIFPAVSTEILNRPFKSTSTGLILPLAIGLVGGSWLFSQFSENGRKKQWISRGALLAGASLVAIASVNLFHLEYSERFIFMMVMLLILGMSAALIFVPSQTFIQETTPPQMRGRIFGLLGVIVNLSSIPPVLFIAAIIEIIGVNGLFFTLGIVSILISGFLANKADGIILATNHRN